jgi:PAS domain S-box-containing protein
VFIRKTPEEARLVSHAEMMDHSSWPGNQGVARSMVMKDKPRTKTQLMDELTVLRKRVTELEESKAPQTLPGGPPGGNDDHFRYFVEHANDIVYSLTPGGVFTYVSPSWKETLGHDTHEVVGQSFGAFVHPEDIPRCRSFLRRVIAMGKRQDRVEHRVHHKNGSWRWHATNASVQRNDAGVIVSIMGIGRDITDYKQMQDALTESEKRFAKAFQASPTPMVISTISEGRYLAVNEQWCDMMGYDREELIGRTAHELSLWADPGERDVLISNYLKDGYFRNELIHLRTKSGDVREVLCSAEIISHKEEVVILSLFSDLTEVKRAESALKESQQRLADIISFLPDATFVIDGEGKVIAWNRAMEEMTDVKAQDMLGKDNYEYALPFYGKRRPILADLVLKPAHEIEAKYLSIKRRDFVLTAEAYMPALKGEEVYLIGKASALKDSRGNIVGAIESIRDITDRKRAEEKYRGIFENAIMGIFQTTPEGRVISANPACAHILGYESDEEIINTVTDMFRQVYVNPERRSEFLYLMENQGTVQEFELQCFRKDRSIIWISINASTFRDSSGNIRYYEGTIQDVTAHKILESQLRQSQKLEAIGTLAGGIAHDFNNILSAIMGYADMALGKIEKDSPLQRYLEQIFKAGVRARALVKQILIFSRQGEGKLRPLRVSPIIREVLSFMRSSLPSTIQVLQEIQADPDMILADPTHIHQIMMNLCTNAVHAMKERKGTLKVRLASGEIRLGDASAPHGLNPGLYLKLTVSDTGTGIDPMVIRRIFDPFFTTKKPGEGTGLGLSVVFGIVNNYGGDVAVHSKVGSGTDVHVYLPLLTETEGKEEEKVGESTLQGKERILFVDDEEVLVDLGKDILTDLGYDVVGKTNSEEALNLFRAGADRFDLVITDMTMPEMTGVELAREIMRLRPGLPVILCTGFSETVTPEKVKAMGIRSLLMKPIIKHQLAKTIRMVLDQEK